MRPPPPIHLGPAAPAVPVSRSNNRISQQLAATTIPDSLAGGNNPALVYTETHQATLIVPAGLNMALTVPIPGISFYFSSVSGVNGVNARFIRRGSPGPLVNYPQGTGLRVGTRGFDKVELQNVTAAATTVTIVVGGGVPNQSYDEYIDKRVIIVNNPASNVFVQNGVTFGVGFAQRVPAWVDTLAAGASQAVADGYLNKARKAIIFTNDDAAAVLQVLDANNNIISDVQPSTAWAQDMGGTVTLKNPSGAGVTCHIGEIYYS